MRSINLLELAARAEILRLRTMAGTAGPPRGVRRRAAIFLLIVLELLEVACWQALRFYVIGIYATLILLGINLVIAGIFGALAARSSPNREEREVCP